MSLGNLPYEIIGIIVQNLDLEDVFHFSISSTRFRYLVEENRSCRSILEVPTPGAFPFPVPEDTKDDPEIHRHQKILIADTVAQSKARATPEARAARTSGQYALALRRLFQRRQAIRSAAPFTAAIVAVAESWLYANGTLCYVQDRTLRVLSLHKSSGEETVINVRALLDEAVPESRGSRKYKFQILHYAEDVVSCLYTHSRPLVESWLVVFNLHERKCLTSLSLESTYKIFVRNNSDYLYFGTHSEFGEDGFRRWVLMGYDIQANRWFDEKVHLLDMVGSDIGQSISFEIIDGHFYGLSNQTSFEVDEVDWTSYYHCFRFPVSHPRPKHTERSVKDRMWRRQHAEGPIDDRWSFIRLLRNDDDGRPQVLESRKEWLAGQSSGRRTYYTTDLIFPPRKEDDDAHENAGSSSAANDDSINIGEGAIASTSGTNPTIQAHTNYNPLVKTEGPVRCPFNTHPGDDASTALLFTLSKCFIRSYHPSSQTFLDLVDNPSQDDPYKPRLQLRAGSRQLRPAAELFTLPAAFDSTLPHTERIKQIYQDDGGKGNKNKITFWPPEKDEARSAVPGGVDYLNRVLNPPSHVGNVRGAWDDRSLIYSTGNNPDGVQAIVFVSFDPAINLQGLRVWNEKDAACGGSTPPEKHVHGASAATGDQAHHEGKGKGKEAAAVPAAGAVASATPKDVGGASPQTVWHSSDAEGGDGACPSWHQQQPSGATSRHVSSCNWAWTEDAMYRQIAFGFNKLPDFSSPRRRKTGT